MRILLTGASSFTGHWFARTLSAQGHEVVATFTGPASAYRGNDVRARRYAAVAATCTCVHDLRFGDARFLALLNGGPRFDRLCHHGAQVGDYRSPDYDVLAAVAANTHAVDAVMGSLARTGTSAVVLTATVFERDEGARGQPSAAASPYGLAKSLSSDICRFYAARHGLPCARFVIPNPFGPLEEARFTAYLMREWQAGRCAEVRTPDYLRDNIHVDLLARAYAAYVTTPVIADHAHCAPSGYVETQGAFAARVAREVQKRSTLACALTFATQTTFDEPRERVNADVPDAAALGFDEGRAWDAFVASYLAADAP